MSYIGVSPLLMLGDMAALSGIVYAEMYTTAGCTSQMDVTLILDRSDYLEPYASAWVVLIAKQLIYGLPVESRRTRVAVITYGDNATVNFDLDQYSKVTDMINQMSFGYMGSRSHLQVLPAYSSNAVIYLDISLSIVCQ